MKISFLNIKDLTQSTYNLCLGIALSNDPDLVILCEVSHWPLSRVEQPDRFNFKNQWNTLRKRAVFDGESLKGIVLLWKNGVSVECGEEYTRRKMVVFRVQGINIVAVHLPCSSNQLQSDRRAYVDELCSVIRKEDPSILIGDFNSEADELGFLEGYTNCWTELHNNPRIKTHHLGGMLDHCYCSTAILQKWKICCNYSDAEPKESPPDHRAVHVSIENS